MTVILATDPAQFSARTTSFGVTSTASSMSTAASTNSICILTTALSAIAIGTVLVAHLAPSDGWTEPAPPGPRPGTHPLSQRVTQAWTAAPTPAPPSPNYIALSHGIGLPGLDALPPSRGIRRRDMYAPDRKTAHGRPEREVVPHRLRCRAAVPGVREPEYVAPLAAAGWAGGPWLSSGVPASRAHGRSVAGPTSTPGFYAAVELDSSFFRLQDARFWRYLDVSWRPRRPRPIHSAQPTFIPARPT